MSKGNDRLLTSLLSLLDMTEARGERRYPKADVDRFIAFVLCATAGQIDLDSLGDDALRLVSRYVAALPHPERTLQERIDADFGANPVNPELMRACEAVFREHALSFDLAPLGSATAPLSVLGAARPVNTVPAGPLAAALLKNNGKQP